MNSDFRADAVFCLLPLLMAVAWVAAWVTFRQISWRFFAIAFGACVASLLVALVRVYLARPATTSISDSLSDDVFWVPYVNAITGTIFLVVLGVVTGIVNGVLRLAHVLVNGPADQRHPVD